MGRGLLMAIIALCAFVAGCSDDVEGSATAGQPAEDAFDPCTIPDAAIASAGLDPASKDSMSEKGYVTPGWEICSWVSADEEAWYFFSASFSPNYDMNDVRNNPQNAQFVQVTLAGRDALSYKPLIVDESEICDLAFETIQGLATFSAAAKEKGAVFGDLCSLVRTHASDLSTALPPS